MSDLISRAEVIEWYCKSQCESKFCGIPCHEVEELIGFSTAELARSKRRGKNISASSFMCSVCGFGDFGGFHGYEPKFCPNCGTRMRGADDE